MRWTANHLLVVLKAVAMFAALSSFVPVAAAEPIRQAWFTQFIPFIPEPHLVKPYQRPMRRAKTEIIEFNSAPFPYEGKVPKTDQPFLNVAADGRLGHRSFSGNVHWQDETYFDPRVLLHVPKGFDIRRPGLVVLFFHGHGATLKRDVLKRQRVAEQISRSGINAVLVAPQLAFNAADSSIGKLWQTGGCRRLLDEASGHLAEMLGGKGAAADFAKMPVVIVGYSGGYVAAANCLRRGRLGDRVRGVVLLDGLYGEIQTFENWLTRNRSGFFVSSYTGYTASNNARLRQSLEDDSIATAEFLAPELAKGSVVFLATSQATHRQYVNAAWRENPIADILQRAHQFVR